MARKIGNNIALLDLAIYSFSVTAQINLNDIIENSVMVVNFDTLYTFRFLNLVFWNGTVKVH